MSSFTRAVFEPTGETRAGRIVWRAAEAFRFDIGFVGSGLSIDVPAGFETDGPSVPWWLAPVAKAGGMVRAAAVHDRLREDLRFSKLDGDAIFLTALEAEGVTAWRRELAFLAVRLNNSRDRAS
jgi:hypothetical protein